MAQSGDGRGASRRPPTHHGAERTGRTRPRGTWPAAPSDGRTSNGRAAERRTADRRSVGRRGAGPDRRAHERMLRRRRRTLLVLGIVVLLVLFGIGLNQLGSPGSTGSGSANQASAADSGQVPGAAGTTSPGPIASASPSPSTSASPSTSPGTGTSATTPGSTGIVVPAADVARCPSWVVACVDLKRHLTWLQRNGKVVYGPVSMRPGGKQSPTPTGTYAVQWKDKHHISGEFGDPMPYSVFFAPGGIAFHQGSQTTSSHGCIHLRPTDAAHYFAALAISDHVKVF